MTLDAKMCWLGLALGRARRQVAELRAAEAAQAAGLVGIGIGASAAER